MEAAGAEVASAVKISTGPASVRAGFYAGAGRRADATFELADAILTAGAEPSPATSASRPSTAAAGAGRRR